MGFWLILKIVAIIGASMADYGHYMGLNLGVFWQTEVNYWPDFEGSNRRVLRAFFYTF